MARIIEALKQAELQRVRPAAPAPALSPEPAPPPEPEPESAPVAEMNEEAAEMPYIEVGGKGTPICASPDVLAAKPAIRPGSPMAPAPQKEQGTNEGPPFIVSLIVTFPPWPKPPSGGR
jgi:hypothetical protein